MSRPIFLAPAPATDAAVEEVLRRDPTGTFARSDAQTQWQYRVALAEWEARTGVDRLELARTALARAGAVLRAEGADAPGAQIGYYLLGGGADALRPATAPSRAARGRLPELEPRLLIPLTTALTTLLLLALGAAVHRAAAPPWATLLAVACAVPLASVYASRATRTLPWRSRRLPLPKLRDSGESEPGRVTLFVVPAIVPSPERARALVHRLAALAEAHPGSGFRFALLSDFADSPTEAAEGDEAVLAELRRAVDALNTASADGRGDRLFVLHRHRTWSATQGAWIGWERKRGKLRELMRLLAPPPGETSFRWRFGDFDGLLARASVPFVITLDETTSLRPGAARELIRTAAHPLNRPVIDPGTGRVASGYTVLQPAVLQADDAGPGPRGVPSFYFRAFGVGLHRGAAALLHPEAFRRAVDPAFPDEVVLHHDLLDGFAGGTGEVYEAVATQPPAPTYLAQARRGHRWLRGIFQSLPFVLPSRGSAAPLTPIQRYFVAEMALTELSTPASLAVLLLAWTVLPGPPLLWTVAASPALLIPIASTLRRVALAPAARRGAGWAGLLPRMAAGVFAHVVLVFQSWLVADALARVAWRLAVSRRHLLEWAPRAESGPTADRLPAYWRALWMSPAAGAATLAAVALVRPSALPVAAPFALAWMVAPVVVGLGDRHLFAGRGAE